MHVLADRSARRSAAACVHPIHNGNRAISTLTLTHRARALLTAVDVGRCHVVSSRIGVSSIVLAKAYPASTVIGIENHEASIAAAFKPAAEAGVGERVRFEVADAAGPATATTWRGSSTVGTTWATRSGRPAARATRWPATGRSCWSSRAGDELAANLNPATATPFNLVFEARS
jgi:hypothetical protein